MKNALILIFFLAFQTTFAQSQEVNVSATVDTNTILIGTQFHLNLEISHPAKVKGEWPQLPDTFSLLEVVQRSAIDTVKNGDNGTLTRRQSFVLTSFDSGYHVIAPLTFNYRLDGDTAVKVSESKPLLITVNSIPVDTTRAIKDIKGQVQIPFAWQDVLPYLLALILAAVAGYFIYRYIKKRKSRVQAPVIEIPKRPAHEIALEELQQLDESKLWQNGNYKAYYTRLSDITRTFIQNRWSVAAMEMTTDEILRLKIVSDQNPEVLQKLKFMLELSDLVKFAKVIPVVYENEQSFANAKTFVEANISASQGKEAES